MNSESLNSLLLKRKTGTTIVSVPFKEGYLIVTDLRATTANYEVFTCNSKIDIQKDFAIAGAGYAIGTDYCAKPVINHFYDVMRHLEYDINQETNKEQLKQKFAAVNLDYLKKVTDPMYGEVLGGSIFILGFSSKNIVTTWVSNLIGETEKPAKTKNLFPSLQDHSEILGVGSGSRYAKGYLCGLNEVKALKQRTFEDALKCAIMAVGHASSMDLASSVLEGLSICVLRKNEKPGLYKWIPQNPTSWDLKTELDLKKCLIKVEKYTDEIKETV